MTDGSNSYKNIEVSDTVLVLRGDAELISDAELRGALNAFLLKEAKDLTIDLSQVPHMSSMYLSMIAMTVIKAPDMGKSLTIRVTPKLMRLFEVAGIAGLGTFQTVEEGTAN